MKHIHNKLWAIAICGLLTLVMPALSQAQLKLVAHNATVSDITLTPDDPSTFAVTQSGEIFTLDVPAMPSSGYMQFTSNASWQADFTGDTPARANLQMRFAVTSPALPTDVTFKFAVPLVVIGNPNGTVGFLGGNGVDSEVITRKELADSLLAGNPDLTAPVARQIADMLFQQGFHVSVSLWMKSLNVSDAVITNPSVAFFAEAGSISTVH